MKSFLFLHLSLFFTSFLFGSSWEKYKQTTIQKLPQFEGWCTQERAEKLMDFLQKTKPKICVEIGTFGGSTTFPIASTLRFLNQGIVYSIDAWENKLACAGLEVSDPNFRWWRKIDMNRVKNRFIQLLSKHQLNKWCKPIHMSSEKALPLFANESVDLLFIDGNFSGQGSLRDVIMYFPKVKKGGFIWINDSDRETKTNSVAFLMKRCSWLKKQSLRNCCIVFQK